MKRNTTRLKTYGQFEKEWMDSHDGQLPGPLDAWMACRDQAIEWFAPKPNPKHLATGPEENISPK